MADFSLLGLKKDILDTLKRLYYSTPTLVQEKVIPPSVAGKNVVFTAMTGSGKTLAYTVGFFSKINKKLGIQMLVVVPTRELAMQVAKEIKRISEPLGYNVGLFYGGAEPSWDRKTLEKSNTIIVGTPGRLIEHINLKNLRVGEVKLLVFDESDQMFDTGFYDDCCYIRSRVGKNSQIILASATLSDKVKEFASDVIGEHVLLEIGSQIPERIVQEMKRIEIPEKQGFVAKLLSERNFAKTLIFCNRIDATERISLMLNEKGFKSISISSQLEQKDREHNLALFKQGKVAILVATDVAARGLHIPNVDAVINYDVPTKPEFYIHRIGRTGRNDLPGYALTLVCSEDEGIYGDILFEYRPDIKEFKEN